MKKARFLVRAESVNAVKRALRNVPGGVEVIGRYDRDTIECAHTMAGPSFIRNWPIVRGRLARAGLGVVGEVGPIAG
ncbi:hypothetical protein Isop_1484 [Isosphaera pallida ATCC 43644]|jgi:hypothetical protein|uniref:Uncharacterized protein n=1 Tax=Isosphaera pallida (strain ATCC 43644 / DSM 9630 / IS1B) TaxID=575540 RepID=E8QY79_ISOPI|nr:hypothetical protein [Isosphaera pallida]ADV62069.1 hypothetical protein Isop_1484 [Isosphaera pallida ATCC 43644]